MAGYVPFTGRVEIVMPDPCVGGYPVIKFPDGIAFENAHALADLVRQGVRAAFQKTKPTRRAIRRKTAKG